jgi:predicted RNA-binding Zn-ribbon protein involved in translation (DUF1610 family)
MSLEDWITEREARKRERPWYDTLQVCMNGHVITDMAMKHPEDQKKRCPTCGAMTIMACQKCNTAIPGHHHWPDGVSVLPKKTGTRYEALGTDLVAIDPRHGVFPTSLPSHCFLPCTG